LAECVLRINFFGACIDMSQVDTSFKEAHEAENESSCVNSANSSGN
jgi:hypothetical protein